MPSWTSCYFSSPQSDPRLPSRMGLAFLATTSPGSLACFSLTKSMLRRAGRACWEESLEAWYLQFKEGRCERRCVSCGVLWTAADRSSMPLDCTTKLSFVEFRTLELFSGAPSATGKWISRPLTGSTGMSIDAGLGFWRIVVHFRLFLRASKVVKGVRCRGLSFGLLLRAG